MCVSLSLSLYLSLILSLSVCLCVCFNLFLKLLHYLKRVNFTTPLGDIVNFDVNADPSASYDIINWQIGHGGTAEFVKVGQYDSHQKLQLDLSKVVWGGGWTNKVKMSANE